MRHHLYLSPGMFGFGRLGSYNYFGHVERELTSRFAAAGHELFVHVINDLPTASIRRRSTRLAETVSRSAGADTAIHLLGHSTGGLDARLVSSPSTCSIPDELLGWLPQLRSVTAMNTPHYGTPLASFFATSKGQHLLAALSMLTFAALTVGERPLRAMSVILGSLRGGDLAIPLKLVMLDRSVAMLNGVIEDACGTDVRSYIAAIEDDQGSMLQLSPESMDLVTAGFTDRPGVHYQSTASMSPSPTPRKWMTTLGHPLRSVSLAVFFGLHHLTADIDERYPCARMEGTTPFAGQDLEVQLVRALGRTPTVEDNDGVTPLRSQLWGSLAWVGLGDHLDVLGHYRDDEAGDDVPADLRHRDWLTSGSAFSHKQFAGLIDAIANGMLMAAS